MTLADALIAINLHDPSAHLWLDNGQPWGFAVAGVLAMFLAIWPYVRWLAVVAGSASLGTVSWRLSTALLESYRDGAPGDWLRAGTWMLCFGVSWIAWASIWLIVGISSRFHVEAIEEGSRAN